MPSPPDSDSDSATQPVRARQNPALARERQRYRYRPLRENQLAPIATAEKWPWLKEQYFLSWGIPFLPYFVGAWANYFVKKALFFFAKISFRAQKLDAYDRLWRAGEKPDWTSEEIGFSDATFAWMRIAGSNSVVIRRAPDLQELQKRIPLDVARIETWLDGRGHTVSLAREAGEGRLFVVDFADLWEGLERAPVGNRTHDSRWREKYLACPIAVFLEAPGVNEGCDLVPLAIQIDQPQPAGVENPVFYPDQADDPTRVDEVWSWRLAKAYFQTADINSHSSVGHVLRGHLLMEPFCVATPRQLPESHPIFVLLRPHTKYTLPANAAAYTFYINRKKTYSLLYSGTLEDSRNISKVAFESHGFRDFGLRADLEERGVIDVLQDYPFRDDAMLWLPPIRTFVSDYVDLYYADDASLLADSDLQAWAEELMDPARGAVRNMVPDERLDTREKLVELLAQVLCIAGPYHSSQHYAGAYYNRQAAIFPSAAYLPPPTEPGERDFSRWWRMLPPIAVAAKQKAYNDFVEYRFDAFGHYDRYPLGRKAEVQPLIAALQASLERIEAKIESRQAGRMLRYDFLKPSRVTNSANI